MKLAGMVPGQAVGHRDPTWQARARSPTRPCKLPSRRTPAGQLAFGSAQDATSATSNPNPREVDVAIGVASGPSNEARGPRTPGAHGPAPDGRPPSGPGPKLLGHLPHVRRSLRAAERFDESDVLVAATMAYGWFPRVVRVERGALPGAAKSLNATRDRQLTREVVESCAAGGQRHRAVEGPALRRTPRRADLRHQRPRGLLRRPDGHQAPSR